MLTDDGGGAYNNTGGVVDEEVFPDGRAGMDVHAGDAVRILSHHAGQKRNLQQKQLMRHAVDSGRQQPRISKDDLVLAVRRRVAVEGGLYVCIQVFPHFRDLAEIVQTDFLRRPLPDDLLAVRVFRVEKQRDLNLLSQVVHHVFNQDAEFDVRAAGAVFLFAVIAGEQNHQQLVDDFFHNFLIRLFEYIHVVDVSAVAVICENLLNDIVHLLVQGVFVDIAATVADPADIQNIQILDVFHCHCWYLTFLLYAGLSCGRGAVTFAASCGSGVRRVLRFAAS